jgi:lysophospholipase L1-like esterase
MRSGLPRLRTAGFAFVMAFACWPAFAQTGSGWTTAWATSQQALGQARVSNATLRLTARVTAPGNAIRLRFDNTFGAAPVTFGKVSVGPRQSANRPAAVSPGLLMPVTFAGEPSVTIAAGASVTSDPVALSVDAQEDLAVSVYVPGADIQASQHGGAVVTSFSTDNGAGDLTASESGAPFKTKITTMPWLKAIDVRAAAPTTAIVAFGDSITDGTCTTLDGHDRWEDVVAQRLALQDTFRRSVVNEGIGGNTVTRNVVPPPDSTPGTERLDRDVLAHAGVSHVVVFMGTNDIRREASAEQVINGLKDIVARVKARGLKVIGVTIVPRHAGCRQYRLGRRKNQGAQRGQCLDSRKRRLRRHYRLRPRGAQRRKPRRPEGHLQLRRWNSPFAARLFSDGKIGRPEPVRNEVIAMK